MKSLLIIYPHDSTTVFLTESFYELQKEIKSATFFEIFPTEDSHNECIKLIPKYEKIIFMGHGSFFKLSSAAAENFKKDCLVTVHDIIALGEKDWILFSCNSNDLLRKCLTYKIGGIGFGNLPTDFNDIQGAREFEPFAYPNVNQNVIEGFKKSINWIITKSILAL